MREGRVYRRCTTCRGDVNARVGKDGKLPPHAGCKGTRSSWAYVVDVARPGEPRQQRSKTGFPTKAAALSAMNALQAEVERGTYVPPSRQTFEEFVTTEFLPAARRRTRPTSYHQTERLLRTHALPVIGGIPLQALTVGDLNELYTQLEESGRRDGKGGLSRQTVVLIHARIRSALKEAMALGRVQRNVASLATAPKVESADLNIWSGHQLRAFLERAADDRLLALWHLLATTGMRRGEALGLRWADVDLDAGSLRIAQQRTSAGTEVLTAAPKTGKGRRTIALDPATVAVLRTHRRTQTEERLAWGPAWVDTGLVFARENGAGLDPQWVSKRFYTLVRQTDLPRIRLHDVRHSYATAALAAGVPVKVLSQRLGHADIAITLRTYARVMPGDDEAAAARVATAIFGQP